MTRLNPVLVILSVCLLAGCGNDKVVNVVVDSDLDAIPPDIEAQIREMGVNANIPRTAGLYVADFPDEVFADMHVSRNIHYGPAERNVLDVFTPATMDGPKPVIIFVHGGGFGAGNKSSPISPFYDNIPYWVASQGLVGVNINYRYAPDSQWPAGIEDLKGVVAWVQEKIAWYGGDPKKIFFWGKSTGASHVADYMADMAKNMLQPQIAGAIFTSGFYALGNEPAWENYYGSDVSLYPERNALPHLVTSPTPILASYAEFDAQMYQDQFNLLLGAMNDAGKSIEALYLRGHSHMSETYAVGTVDDSLTGPVLDFVLRHSAD